MSRRHGGGVSGASAPTTTRSGRRPQRHPTAEAGEDATPLLELTDESASLTDRRLRWWRRLELERRGGDGSCSGGKRDVSKSFEGWWSGGGDPRTRWSSPARGWDALCGSHSPPACLGVLGSGRDAAAARGLGAAAPAPRGRMSRSLKNQALGIMSESRNLCRPMDGLYCGWTLTKECRIEAPATIAARKTGLSPWHCSNASDGLSLLGLLCTRSRGLARLDENESAGKWRALEWGEAREETRRGGDARRLLSSRSRVASVRSSP
nr:unnamed protein product [Digitaria exilis]